MKRYQIETYPKVWEFIKRLDTTRQARVVRIYDLFRNYGPNLPSRYLKKTAKDLWELRPGDVRLFLAIKGSKGFVVHGIRKKSKKIPKKDLDLATKRIKGDEILR